MRNLITLTRLTGNGCFEKYRGIHSKPTVNNNLNIPIVPPVVSTQCTRRHYKTLKCVQRSETVQVHSRPIPAQQEPSNHHPNKKNQESKTTVISIKELGVGTLRTRPTLPGNLVSEPGKNSVSTLLQHLSIRYPELVAFHFKACQCAL